MPMRTRERGEGGQETITARTAARLELLRSAWGCGRGLAARHEARRVRPTLPLGEAEGGVSSGVRPCSRTWPRTRGRGCAGDAREKRPVTFGGARL